MFDRLNRQLDATRRRLTPTQPDDTQLQLSPAEPDDAPTQPLPAEPENTRLPPLPPELDDTPTQAVPAGPDDTQLQPLPAEPADTRRRLLPALPEVTRRRLLTALPGVAGLALVAGVAARSAETKPTTENRATTRPRTPPLERATTAPPPPRSMPAQHRPIFTLEEYERTISGPAFPSDAVALTIDDGPHPVWTPKILDLLDRYHVPALFCMIGNQVLGHEQVARSVARAGHQLANHTWSHPTKLAGKSHDQVRKEIARAQEKIYDTTGYAPKLFRSPGGDWSPTVLQESAHASLVPLDWSDDPRDWARPGITAIQHRLLAARPGQILLCHDGGGDRSQTYTALSRVIPALTARGLRFVAL